MKPSDLKVGDRIRIIGMAGEGVPNYYLPDRTRRVYRKLMERGRSVRIARIDERGIPWYDVRFQTKDEGWCTIRWRCSTAITTGCW